MPTKIYQNNFVGGVISPSLFARSDLAVYYKAAAYANNFVISKEGSLRKRRGFKSFADITTDIDWSSCRMFPYRYDRTQSAVLLVYTDSSTSGMSLKCRVYSKNSWGETHQDNVLIDSVTMTPEQVKAFQCTQIGDTLFLSNGVVFKKIVMVRNDSGDLFIDTIDDWEQAPQPAAVTSIGTQLHKGQNPNPDGPADSRGTSYAAYVVRGGAISKAKTSTLDTPIPWTAGTYVTVTVNIGSNRDDFDYVVVGKRSGALFGEICRFFPESFTNGSASFKDNNILEGDSIYPQTNILTDGWNNDPLCTNAFQQRLVFANASLTYTKTTGTGKDKVTTTSVERYPMTLWFSEVGNIDNFYASRPASEADSFSPTIFSTGPAFIRFMCSFQETLVLLTDCGLFSISFSQQNGFSYKSCRISKFSDIACSPNIAPVTTSAGVVFVAADEKSLFTINYDIQDNALKPANQSVLVEHITRNRKIKSIALAEFPQNVVWCTLDDGTLASFTFERDQDVYAWSTSDVSAARVLDCVSLGTVTDRDGERTYTDLVFAIEINDSIYLCSFNDIHTDLIGNTESNVCAELVTLRPESQERTISGQPKNVKDVMIKVYRTGNVCVQAEGGCLDPVCGDASGDLVTGDIKIMPHGHINDDGQIRIISDNEQPCEILAVKQVLEL